MNKERDEDSAVSAQLAAQPYWDALSEAGRVEAPSPSAVDAAVAAVRTAASTVPAAGDPIYPKPPRRWLRAPRVLVTAAIAAAITAYLVIVPSLGPMGRPSASAAAAQALSQAADAVRHQDPVTRPGQYWRIVTRGTSLAQTSDTVYLVRQQRIEYVAVDGRRPSWFVDDPSEVVRQLTGAPGAKPPSSNQRPDIWTTNLAPTDLTPTWQTPSPQFLAALPRDTQALRDRLYADAAGHGNSKDGEVLVYVNDVLRSGLVPADLRRALYRVLATVPGVEITDSRVAVHGRSGVAFGRLEAVDGVRQEIIIDPATGEFIGERQVLVNGRDGLPAGLEIAFTQVQRTLVDTVPANVVKQARHDHCATTADGAITCSPG